MSADAPTQRSDKLASIGVIMHQVSLLIFIDNTFCVHDFILDFLSPHTVSRSPVSFTQTFLTAVSSPLVVRYKILSQVGNFLLI